MDDKYFYPEMGTGKQTYLNQVELEQLNKQQCKKKGGKIIVQEVEGGAFWMPIVAELLGPVIKKVLGGGQCSEKQMETKLKKHLRGAGFFGDLAKSLAKAVLPKLVQGATTALANKAQDVASKGTASLLDTVEKKITGKGKKCKKGGKVQIGGCGDPEMPCPEASKKAPACTGGAVAKKRALRNALVKKLMQEEKLSLPQASKAVKERGLKY